METNRYILTKRITASKTGTLKVFCSLIFAETHATFYAELTKAQTAAVVRDSLVFAKVALAALVGLSPPSPPVRCKKNSIDAKKRGVDWHSMQNFF